MCPISRPGQKLIVQEMLFAVGSVIIGCTDQKVHVLADSLKSAARNFILTISIQKAECFYQPSALVTSPLLRLADCHYWCVKGKSRGIQRDLINQS